MRGEAASEEVNAEAVEVVQVQDGGDLIQTRGAEVGPDLASSLEVECTGAVMQVDVKDEGGGFGLCDWMDKEYWRQSSL